MMKYIRGLLYYPYRIYAELYLRFHQHEWRYEKLPPIPCQICGGNHVELLCPNAWRMVFKYGVDEEATKKE